MKRDAGKESMEHGYGSDRQAGAGAAPGLRQSASSAAAALTSGRLEPERGLPACGTGARKEGLAADTG